MTLPAKWSTLNNPANSQLVQTVEEFKQAMQTIVTVVETVVDITKTVADFVLKFFYEMSDIYATAITAAIETLRAILKSIEGTGMYALFVPPKIFMANVSNEHQYYIPNTNFSGIAYLDSPVSNPVLSGKEGSAGNYGFYQQVVDSLSDDLDIMRPRFGADAYVTAAVLLFGSNNSYFDVILALRKLEALFDVPGSDILTTNQTGQSIPPTPKDPRAHIIPTPMSSDMPFWYFTETADFYEIPNTLRIDWTADDRLIILNDANMGALYFEISDVILYKWESSQMTVKTAEALARTGIDTFRNAGGTATATSIVYDPLCTTFMDPIKQLGKYYTYMLGYTLTWVDDQGNVLKKYSNPFAFSSFTIPIPETIQIAPRHGVPPDWTAARLIDFIPALQKFIIWANNWLDTIEAGVKSGKDALQDFITSLEKELNRYDRQVKEVLAIVSELIEALSLPEVYMGIWVLPPNQGGNAYLTEQLGRSLLDTADQNRPPFDKGTEIVGGIVLYVGADSIGKIAGFWDGINLLFGNAVNSQTSALQDAITSLNAITTDAKREIQLLENLNKGTVEAITSAGSAIGEDMNPSIESTVCQQKGENSVQRARFTGTGALTSGK